MPEIYGILARDYEGVTPRMPTIWSTHPQLEARAARTRGQVASAPAGRRDTEQFDAVVLPIRTLTIRDYIQDDYPRTAIALAEKLAARYPEQAELCSCRSATRGRPWARAREFDEEELSNRAALAQCEREW